MCTCGRNRLPFRSMFMSPWSSHAKWIGSIDIDISSTTTQNSEEVEPQTNILKTAPAMNIPVRKSPTFSVIGRLKGSGLIVTVPLSASFNTPADIVVFIGTPNLLKSTTEQMCPSETVGSTFSNYHPPHLHSKGAVICTSHHVRWAVIADSLHTISQEVEFFFTPLYWMNLI
jgi:hypothetical protein